MPNAVIASQTVKIHTKEGGTMQSNPRYINEKEVSNITGLALSTLRNDRATLRRRPYCKVGRSVRYLLDDVINFMESNKIASSMNKNGADDFKISLTI